MSSTLYLSPPPRDVLHESITGMLLPDLLRLLRANGVRHFEGHGLRMEMAPLPATAETPAAADPMCPCGHSWPEHGDVGCLRGCDHEACTPAQIAGAE